jgi:hypothetical protein
LGIELAWDAAASRHAAFDLIEPGKYHLALVDIALTDDATNRDGIAVAVAAHLSGAHVFVCTAYTLSADEQFMLSALGIHTFIKPMPTEDLVAHITLAAVSPRRQRLPVVRDALAYIAKLLRELDGPLPEIVKQLQALVVEEALAETKGNKTEAARVLKTDRHFIDRALANLPRKSTA